MTWWDTDYIFRRNLKVIAASSGAPIGHSMTAIIPSLGDMNKVLNSFQDLVVTFNTTPLARQIVQNDDNITVTFNAFAELESNEVVETYFIYYTNPNTTFVQAPYTLNEWPVSVLYDSTSVTYTRPGEDWVDGVSTIIGAKASFSFNGVRLRLISSTGPDQGIAELQLDNLDWVLVDLYSPSEVSGVTVFEVTDLTPGDHFVRIRSTGSRNAGATDNKINIVRFDYMKYVQVIDLGEEAKDLTWNSSLGGM